MTEIVDDKTMVERVAETIWAENAPPGVPPYWDLDLLDQVRVKQIARACIKAMREPTEEMLEASTCIGALGLDWKVQATTEWQRLIDAALKED